MEKKVQTCSHCRLEKSISEFGPSKKTLTGYSRCCLECSKLLSRAFYARRKKRGKKFDNDKS